MGRMLYLLALHRLEFIDLRGGIKFCVDDSLNDGYRGRAEYLKRVECTQSRFEKAAIRGDP